MRKPTRIGAATSPGGRYGLADAIGPAAPAELEPLLRIEDLARVLTTSRSSVERMLSAGALPPPDLRLGTSRRRSPRWHPATIARWIAEGGAR